MPLLFFNMLEVFVSPSVKIFIFKILSPTDDILSHLGYDTKEPFYNNNVKKEVQENAIMEIERKYRIHHLPFDPDIYPHTDIEQGYLCTRPVIRARKDGDRYYMTYKGEGLLAREEYDLPLDASSYRHLIAKADGIRIAKTRYRIPAQNGLTIELDIFHGTYEGLILAEVEFPDMEAAEHFTPPDYFGEEVTFDPKFQNSFLSRKENAGSNKFL